MSDKPQKFSQGKPDYTLLPWNGIDHMAKIMTDNLEDNGGKYKRDNWKRWGSKMNEIYLPSLIRHLRAYMKGEIIDPEDGHKHMAKVMINASFIIWAEEERESSDE